MIETDSKTLLSVSVMVTAGRATGGPDSVKMTLSFAVVMNGGSFLSCTDTIVNAVVVSCPSLTLNCIILISVVGSLALLLYCTACSIALYWVTAAGTEIKRI